MGRKTKLTPELTNQLCQMLRAGNYIETSCQYVGINQDTFFEWLKRGERGGETNKPYADFSEAIEKARAVAIVANVGLVQKAATGGTVIKEITRKRTYFDEEKQATVTETETEKNYAAPQWQAAAWWLERSQPKQWGRKPVEITGPGGGPIQVVAFDYGATMKQLPAPSDDAGPAQIEAGTIIDADAIELIETED